MRCKKKEEQRLIWCELPWFYEHLYPVGNTMQSVFLHSLPRLSGGCWHNPAAGHREDMHSPFCRYPAPTLPVAKVDRPTKYKHLLLQAVMGYQGGNCKDTKPLAGSVCKFDFMSVRKKSAIAMARHQCKDSSWLLLLKVVSKFTQPVALRKRTQNNKELKSEFREGIKNGAVTITQMQFCTQKGTVH